MSKKISRTKPVAPKYLNSNSPNQSASDEASGSKYPDNSQLTVAFYTAARAEALQRLMLREQTFLAYITTVGLIIGFSVARAGPNTLFEPRLLKFVPLLCLPFSATIYRHIFINRVLGAYLTQELHCALRQDQKDSPRHWDTSRSLQRALRSYVVVETVVYFIMLTGVPVAALLYLHFIAQVPWTDPIMLVGEFCCTFVAVFGLTELWKAFRNRWNAWK